MPLFKIGWVSKGLKTVEALFKQLKMLIYLEGSALSSDSRVEGKMHLAWQADCLDYWFSALPPLVYRDVYPRPTRVLSPPY
jgi:hypothetical protein